MSRHSLWIKAGIEHFEKVLRDPASTHPCPTVCERCPAFDGMACHDMLTAWAEMRTGRPDPNVRERWEEIITGKIGLLEEML